jgi:GNAT superfamily N-acetyltransferase
VSPMRLCAETKPDPDDVALLERRIAEQMLSTSVLDDARELASFVRADDGAIRAGVYGWTWGGCCELQHLWVDDDIRGTGLGRSLLAWAEDEARSRGCTQVVLFTHGSQASGLYARRAYELVGRVQDYPLGDSALWLRKVLAFDNGKFPNLVTSVGSGSNDSGVSGSRPSASSSLADASDP